MDARGSVILPFYLVKPYYEKKPIENAFKRI